MSLRSIPLPYFVSILVHFRVKSILTINGYIKIILIAVFVVLLLDTLHLPQGEVCPKPVSIAFVHIPLEQPNNWDI